MKSGSAYCLGVDGGGSGTRVAIARMDSPLEVLARGRAGPSGLALGVVAAWTAIEQAMTQACQSLGIAVDWSMLNIGCGLAGANHRPWRDAFIAQAPAPIGALHVVSDADTTVWGAHLGRAGVAIALGTGSVAVVSQSDGRTCTCGGFGFPSGDEASGAWLGMRALAHAQRATDGRAPFDEFAMALHAAMGISPDMTGDVRRAQVLTWSVTADQTAYATLAPVVIAFERHPVAHALLDSAARDIVAMADALDPDANLPIALCGSLGAPLGRFTDATFQARCVLSSGDAVVGALLLAAGRAGPDAQT